ncbi:MAG: TlyA family RNA methyltransferase [Aquificota bacterium]|nr:MAG: TlyA family RNA methyltransferase [Aquificota bacterium]
MAKKERLDKLLVEKGFVESREKAQRLIMSGVVFVNGQKVDKPGTKVPVDSDIFVKEKEKYVSRGGYKLEKAINVFHPDIKGKVCVDIGSSTGGFTDCLLQHGAKKVYAVDVGTHQLHEKLRNREDVVVLEKTNARYLTEKEIPEKVECFVSDVSFISILKIMPNLCSLIKDFAEGVILIKPQFELSREEVKGGVVKDPLLHEKAIKKVIDGLEESCYCVKDLSFSETWGPEGNIEFLAYVIKKPEDKKCDEIRKKLTDDFIKKVVEEAHKKFKEEKLKS